MMEVLMAAFYAETKRRRKYGQQRLNPFRVTQQR